MRYVVYGAGAIGGVIGARLHLTGHEVALIARGAHLAALRERGLVFTSAGGTRTLPIPAASSPAELALTPDDTVILAMKSQDTAGALEALAAVAPPAIAVVCAQNGVANERMALRRFANVYGQLVILPGTHLEPGAVIASASPVYGVLDLGRYPRGVDTVAERIARDLADAGFAAEPRESVMPWKYAKLLRNLANAAQAVLASGEEAEALAERARAEARACFAAAAVETVSDDAFRERFQALSRIRSGSPAARSGNSSWQSLQRGAPTIETAWLNGEIALLGRLHGVPAPVNALLCRVAEELAAAGRGPGALTLAQFEARL